MDTLSIKKFNNIKYYNADELKNVIPIVFKGCRNSREIISKRNIDENNYTYAKETNNKWKVTDGKSMKCDKLFLSKDWIDEYLADNTDVKEAPEIINLKDNEKFKDNDGIILEIETRGCREYDNCFFKVSDVAKGFGMKKLYQTIIDDRLKYVENTHYVYFNCKNVGKNNNITSKKLFLTYLGILRVLFVSKNGSTDRFVGWATKTLFTAQMGTPTDKKQLSANLLGIPVKDMKSVFSKTSRAIPTIYMFSLGTVKDLRKTFTIGSEYFDTDIVAKIGMTEDLKRRSGEHEREYGKMKNVSVQLMQYNYIDPQYMSKAETDLKDAFGGFGLMFEHAQYDELIIFNMKKMKLIKKQFEQIGTSYIGHISELVIKIKNLENAMELEKEKHKNELEKEKHKNELLKEQHEVALLRKELEISKLRFKIK